MRSSVEAAAGNSVNQDDMSNQNCNTKKMPASLQAFFCIALGYLSTKLHHSVHTTHAAAHTATSRFVFGRFAHHAIGG